MLNERLYVVGGHFGDDENVHRIVELFDPVAYAWRQVAPLGVGRSGLGLCAAHYSLADAC